MVRDKDGGWQSCAWKMVCDKVVCVWQWCDVEEEEEEEAEAAEEEEAEAAGSRIKNKNPTQRCGEKKNGEFP